MPLQSNSNLPKWKRQPTKEWVSYHWKYFNYLGRGWVAICQRECKGDCHMGKLQNKINSAPFISRMYDLWWDWYQTRISLVPLPLPLLAPHHSPFLLSSGYHLMTEDVALQFLCSSPLWRLAETRGCDGGPYKGSDRMFCFMPTPLTPNQSIWNWMLLLPK